MTLSPRPSPAAQSRAGKKAISGYFGAEVARELKKLAADQDLPVQSLLAIAINDLFERYGRQRIADETPLPRGGAAQKLYRESGS